MAKKIKARRGGDLARAPDRVCLAADAPENALPLSDRQAAWIARRLGLTLSRARVLAGLAFANGRAA